MDTENKLEEQQGSDSECDGAALETSGEAAALTQAPDDTPTDGTVETDGGAHTEVKKPRFKVSKRTVLRWTLIHIGIIMMSSSVYFFQVPNNFTLGGIAGIAILLANVTNGFMTQGTYMIIINAILLVVGFIILGRQIIIRTLYCSLMYTGLIRLLEIILPLDGSLIPVTEINTLTNQPLLELVYGILLFGIGGAIIFNCGASSGGTDIIALILKKFSKLNIGMALFIIDFIVVCISFFSSFNVETFMFSFMGLFAKSFLLDGVIENMAKTKYITIITTKPDEIGRYILTVINHSYTIYDAEGGYTKEPKKVIITICKPSEAMKIKAIVKQLDEGSFIIISDANEILGKGFGGTI